MPKVVLLGSPKSTQSIYRAMSRGGHAVYFMTKDGKDVKTSYTKQAREQFTAAPFQGPVDIDVRLYFDSHRKHDIDNYGKLLLDSLTGVLWVDDDQIVAMRIEKFYDKDAPRIEITCSPRESS